MKADPQSTKETRSNNGDLQPIAVLFIIAMLLWAFALPASAQQSPAANCDAGNGGITLSPGFCATVFADKIHRRNLKRVPFGRGTGLGSSRQSRLGFLA